MASLKIGTRTSTLARVQTDMVASLLTAAHSGLEVEIVPIKPSGDWRPEQGEQRLSEAMGGKGLFIKELEQALLNGEVDCCVHCLKDVPSFLPLGVAVDHVLEREDARDVLIGAASFKDIPHGAIVGTASPRRQSILLAARPDLKVVTFRGNIDTRLEKLRAGQVDVAVLAAVGLKRLHRESEIGGYLSPDEMLPACGQGTLCLETRVDDTRTRELLNAITHHESTLVSAAERAVLIDLDGSCRTAIGAYATLQGVKLTCRAMLGSLDGREIYKAALTDEVTSVAQASELGMRVAEVLGAQAGVGAMERLSCNDHQNGKKANA